MSDADFHLWNQYLLSNNLIVHKNPDCWDSKVDVALALALALKLIVNRRVPLWFILDNCNSQAETWL